MKTRIETIKGCEKARRKIDEEGKDEEDKDEEDIYNNYSFEFLYFNTLVEKGNIVYCEIQLLFP